LKGRSDNENGTREKQTWIAVTDLYKNQDSSDADLDEIDYTSCFDQHNHLINNSGYEDIQLTQFTATMDNGNELKKYITGLFKLRQEMKALMTTVSGTHNNYPMAFVDNAKKKVKNVSAHRLVLYYFYIKCKQFASSLPEEMKGSSHNKPPLEVFMTPGGGSVCTSKSSSKKSSTKDFSDASVQAFHDIAAMMREKHSTDKMFRLLAMDGVSPNTKRNIQNALLQEFCPCSTAPAPPLAKVQKTSTSGIDEHRSMSHIHPPIAAEDYVCGMTVNSNSDDDESSVTKDPDCISKSLLS
jgi:hypothetical protein